MSCVYYATVVLNVKNFSEDSGLAYRSDHVINVKLSRIWVRFFTQIQIRMFRFFTKMQNVLQLSWILWVMHRTGYFGYIIRSRSPVPERFFTTDPKRMNTASGNMKQF